MNDTKKISPFQFNEKKSLKKLIETKNQIFRIRLQLYITIPLKMKLTKISSQKNEKSPSILY